MLKQRILTAAILIPLVVFGILELSTFVVSVIFALFLIIGTLEWCDLAGLKNPLARIGYVMIMPVLMWFTWPVHYMPEFYTALAFLILVWWVIVFLWIMNPKLGSSRARPAVLIKLLAGILLILPTWYALHLIHAMPESGPVWLLFILSIIWVADSGAYFAGRAFGKHKLAPVVSPGKTWEGVAGALALTALYIYLVSFWLPSSDVERWQLIVLGLVLVPVSIIGDLFESLMKRQANIKDSGQILPGHGGIMDRIDSMTSVLPVSFSIMVLAGYL